MCSLTQDLATERALLRKETVHMSRQPAITNSPRNLGADIIDIMIENGSFKPLWRYPASQRARVRRTYVDMTIGQINRYIKRHNDTCTEKAMKWQYVQTLNHDNIMRIIIAAENAKRLRTDPRIDPSQAALAFYNPETGVYSYEQSYQVSVIADYIPSDWRTINSIYNMLLRIAPGGIVNQDPNLVNFVNGVLDRTNGKLMKHSPEYNFTNSLAVRYNPNAKNKHFTDSQGDDWDVESWMAGLSDDPSVVDVLWETVAACLRPGEHWNKTPWLYSVVGANGKGSLCELIRQIVGSTATASLSVADFGNDYMITQLMNTTCVVTDENPVGTVIDKLSSFKAAVTGDIFTINRKYHDPVRFTYNGIILQCMNSMPQAKDRTGSFYRRQLFIPMEKNFAHVEKSEIKTEFLRDQEVCEYVAKRCMDMQFKSFSNPARCAEVLEEYKTYNDIVREFALDVLEDIPWDFIPNQLLLDLFVKWHARNYPGHTCIGRNKFLADFRQVVKSIGGWVVPNQDVKTDTSKFNFSARCELLYDYDLGGWNTSTTVSDPVKVYNAACTLDTRHLKRRMSGVIRDTSLKPATRMAVVDYDESQVTFESAFKLVNTNANVRRDYGLGSDDKISDRVAAQIAGDPECMVTNPDLDVNAIVLEDLPGLTSSEEATAVDSAQNIANIMASVDDETKAQVSAILIQALLGDKAAAVAQQLSAGGA